MRLENIILIVLTFLLVACGQQARDEISRVNGRSISAEEFIFTYETSPRIVTAGPKNVAYVNVLDRLIQRVLFSQESQRLGLHKEPQTVRELNYLEDAAIRRELFREKVRGVVVVDEDAVREAFQLAQKTLWVQHVMLEAGLMEKPEIWNPDWQHETINPTLKRREVTDLGMVDLVSWNDLDSELESVLFQLEVGEWTPPIQRNGFSHLFRLVNIETNQMVSENQFVQDREHYQTALRKRLEHARAFAFIQETMEPENLIIKRPALEQLTQVLWSMKLSKDSIPESTGDEYLLETPTLDEIRGSELAHYESGNISIDDFIFYFQMNPQKLESGSMNALRQKLINTIGIYVRDIVFAEMGRQEGLHKNTEVMEDIRYWHERLLASKLEKHIYDRTASEAESEGELDQSLVSQEIAELGKALREHADIGVDHDLLMSLKTSDDGLPRKIDFFTTYLN